MEKSARSPSVSSRRPAIIAAYMAYVAGEPDAEENLLALVQNFATAKAEKELFESAEQAKNADDVAQETTIYVWKNLGKFKGDGKAFFSWVNRSTFTDSKNAAIAARKQMRKSVALTVTDEYGSRDDNPALYGPQKKIPYRRALPDFITGVDLRICQHIREGLDYGQIAEVLEITRSAVTQRIAAMKKRILDQSRLQQAEFA
jgi:DNA-directed RNA polymerase specialized sigma24 family protein